MICQPCQASSATPTYALHLAHLIRMASIPGFKEHAWHRAKQLDADSTGQWTGIAQALTAEMQRLAKGLDLACEPRGRK